MSSEPNAEGLSIKEAVVILGAMVFIAVVTLTFAVRMLRSSQIVEKSTREANPPTLREPLPVPVVKPLPPKPDEDDE